MVLVAVPISGSTYLGCSTYAVAYLCNWKSRHALLQAVGSNSSCKPATTLNRTNSHLVGVGGTTKSLILPALCSHVLRKEVPRVVHVLIFYNWSEQLHILIYHINGFNFPIKAHCGFLSTHIHAMSPLFTLGAYQHIFLSFSLHMKQFNTWPKNMGSFFLLILTFYSSSLLP